MNLIEKLSSKAKLGLAGFVLGSTAILSSGCGLSDAEMGGLALSVLAPYSKNPRIGQSMAQVGQGLYQSGYGRATTPQTNLNVTVENQGGQMSPPSYPNSPPDNSELRHYSGKMSDGSFYEGTLLNNIPHGSGSYAFHNGDKYVGEFKKGVVDGRGVLAWSDGRRYEGEWKNSQCDGRGVLAWSDGRRYEGEWKNGRFDGRGVLAGLDGGRYEGEWKNGQYDGRGELILKGGIKVIGDFDNDKFTDNIRMVFPPGFQDIIFYNSRTGRSDGCLYLGEFEGVKNEFRTNEELRAASYWAGSSHTLEGRRITLDINALDTNKKFENYGIVEIDPDNVIRFNNNSIGMWASHYKLNPTEIKEKLGGERFEVVWKMDGIEKKKAEFKILEPLEVVPHRQPKPQEFEVVPHKNKPDFEESK